MVVYLHSREAIQDKKAMKDDGEDEGKGSKREAEKMQAKPAMPGLVCCWFDSSVDFPPSCS